MGIITKKIVELAKHEVGVRESGGNNKGSQIVVYQKATWLPPNPWAWCAAFCCWVLKEALKDKDVAKQLGLDDDKKVDHWRCRDASAFGWEKWAKSRGLQVLTETAKAKAGDFVVFDFSHIGIVVEDQTGDYIETVEGNTNGKGERDSVSGDGVWRKRRHKSLTKSYIRIVA